MLATAALLGAATTLHAAPAEELIERLAAPDAQDREAARRDLLALGDSARPALQAGEEDPRPAIRATSTRLLRRLDAGITEMAPSVREELAGDAITAVDPDARDAAARLRQLIRRPIAAAPSLARVLERVLPSDRQADQRLLELFLSSTAQIHVGGDASTWLNRSDRPAIVAALVARPNGVALLQQWLEAANETGELAPAIAAADETSIAWRWVRGEPDAELPPLLSGLSDEDKHLVAAARTIVYGLPLDVANLDGGRAEAARWAAALTSQDGDLEQAAAELEAAAEREGSARLWAARGRFTEAFAAAEPTAVGQLGLLWAHGDYAEFRDFSPPDAPPVVLELVNRAKVRVLQELLESRGLQQRPEIEGYERMRLASADALLANDERLAVTRLADLAVNDAANPGWLQALADRSGAASPAARLAPLEDPIVRLDAARIRFAYAVDEQAEDAAMADATHAAMWSLLALPSSESRAMAVVTFRRAASLAEEAGDTALAGRLSAATMLLALRSDVAEALAEQATQWPGLAPEAQLLGLVADVRRARMKLAQERGDEAAAVAEYKENALAAAADVEATISRVRHLDAIGDREAAGDAFNEQFVRLQGLLAQLERSSMLHNQAAWLAARSHRRADTAKRLAGTATSLRANDPAYLDTLAEALAASGEAELAEQTMRDVLLISADWEFPMFVMRYAEVRATALGE